MLLLNQTMQHGDKAKMVSTIVYTHGRLIHEMVMKYFDVSRLYAKELSATSEGCMVHYSPHTGKTSHV